MMLQYQLASEGSDWFLNGEIGVQAEMGSRLVMLFPVAEVVAKIDMYCDQAEVEFDIYNSIKAMDKQFFAPIYGVTPLGIDHPYWDSGALVTFQKYYEDTVHPIHSSCENSDLVNFLCRKYNISDMHSDNWFEVDGLPILFDLGFTNSSWGGDDFCRPCFNCGMESHG